MIRCDALIVGGGPAGLAAAIALRQKGLDVLVADALRPPIDKACGEGLMPDARKIWPRSVSRSPPTMALPSTASHFYPGITRRQPISSAAAASASAACNSIRYWLSAVGNWVCDSPGAAAST